MLSTENCEITQSVFYILDLELLLWIAFGDGQQACVNFLQRLILTFTHGRTSGMKEALNHSARASDLAADHHNTSMEARGESWRMTLIRLIRAWKEVITALWLDSSCAWARLHISFIANMLFWRTGERKKQNPCCVWRRVWNGKRALIWNFWQ